MKIESWKVESMELWQRRMANLGSQELPYKSMLSFTRVRLVWWKSSSHKSLILGTTQLQFCRLKWILNAYIVTQTKLSCCFKSIYYSQGEQTKFAFMILHCRGRSLKHFAKSFIYRSSLWNFGLTYLTLRRLMSYICGAPILDVSRSHTTTQHSR